jgi:hypothetical protein
MVGLKLSIGATWHHRDVLQAIHSIPYLHLRPFHPFTSTRYGRQQYCDSDELTPEHLTRTVATIPSIGLPSSKTLTALTRLNICPRASLDRNTDAK